MRMNREIFSVWSVRKGSTDYLSLFTHKNVCEIQSQASKLAVVQLHTALNAKHVLVVLNATWIQFG